MCQWARLRKLRTPNGVILGTKTEADARSERNCVEAKISQRTDSLDISWQLRLRRMQFEISGVALAANVV